MSSSPLVSVIIPSYNHANYIRDAIASVVTQSYDNWELIVVDDGSSDHTAEVLETYIGQPRIKVICNSVNRGQSAVVNQALKLSGGQFVCFLPSDDWYLPDKLKLQVEKFGKLDESYGIVYGRGQRFFEDTGEVVPSEEPRHAGWVLKELVKRNFVYPITPMFRRGCFDRFPFDESYRAEGEAIYLKIALAYKFEFVDAFVGVMRDHSYNTGKDTELMYADNLKYWQEFFSRPDLPDEVRAMREWRISRLMRVKGLDYVMLKGRPAEGRSLLLSSIRMWPKGMFEVRLLSAIALSMLPSSWIDRLYSRRRRKKGD